MSVRSIFLAPPRLHHRSDGKERSENDDFIIISRQFTGSSPCCFDAFILSNRRTDAGVCQHISEMRGTGSACAGGVAHKPFGDVRLDRRDYASDVLIAEHAEYGNRAAATGHACEVSGKSA